MEIYERIKKRREQKGIKQKELASMLNMPANTYNGYEKGNRHIDANLLKDIANILDCSSDYLLGRTNDPQNRVIEKQELPKELVDIGIEYIEMIKEAKASDISPEDIKEIIQLFKKMKK